MAPLVLRRVALRGWMGWQKQFVPSREWRKQRLETRRCDPLAAPSRAAGVRAMTPAEELDRATDLRERCCDEFRSLMPWTAYNRAALRRSILALRNAIGAEAQARRAVQLEAQHV